MEAENAPTHIEVYIIRHGERTDEANVKENYRKEDERWNAVPADCFGSCPKPTFQQAVPTSLIHTPPECDTFDPLLTEKGHYQAQEAWKSVTDLIPSWKPVAIFSSPMRRAVGTAMMVGSVTTRWNSFPNPRSLADPKENESRNADIPITIVNELGDFASAVERRGGAKELVPQSCIACAAMDRNNGDLASPFYQALMKMPSHKVPVASMDLVRKIQFWKMGQDRCYLPMSPPICIQNPKNAREPINIYRNYRSPKLEKISSPLLGGSMEAINHAVRETVRRNCQVCIIVAHREAIRDMATDCNFLVSGLRLPYCCVASLGASVEYKTGNVSYAYVNTWARDRLVKEVVIPRWYPSTGVSIIMIHRSNGNEPIALCSVKATLLDGWVIYPQIWVRYPKDQHTVANGDPFDFPLVSQREYWDAALQHGGILQGFIGMHHPRWGPRLYHLIATTAVQTGMDHISLFLQKWS